MTLSPVVSPSMLDTPQLPGSAQIRESIRQAVVHLVTGQVAAIVGDNIEAEGLTVATGAICEVKPSFGDSFRAMVTGFRDGRTVLSPLERCQCVSEGDSIRLIGHSRTVPVGPSLCGRVVDALGRPIDGKPLPRNLFQADTNARPPESIDRPKIDQPLETGIRAIDAMLTCGQGQRLGIFAGSGVGKSTLLGMLARGCNADRIVVALIGERGREVQDFIDRCLGQAGLPRSVVVLATSDAPAAQRVEAAFTATTIAESFRDRGENVLLLMDSVTRLSMAQREIGLAAGEPPTTRGYPPSVFSLLPRLIERAGRSIRGSITAFYSVLVEGDDPNEPIADTLRGLLDGHIMLDRKLANEAHWPPINVLESVSRLQPHLVSNEVLAASESARRSLNEYRNHRDLISIGAYQAGTDPKLDRAIALQDPLNRLMRQSSDKGCPLHSSQQELVSIMNGSD